MRGKGKVYGYLAQGVDKLQARLQAQGYDAVVCLHPLAAMMMTSLRYRYGAGTAAYFVSTDYTCSPPAGETKLGGYFIPHGGLWMNSRPAAPRYKLIPRGIPVEARFYESVEKEQAKALLDLPVDKRNVLLMCGSMGCGPMEELAERLAASLPADALLSVISGTNEKLLHNLSKQNWANVRLFGYTKKAPLFMDSAELFLTKPGGVSISEAAAKRLPMALIDAVGGCEKYNRAYFTGNGWAQTADSPAAIAQCCAGLLACPEELGACSSPLAAAYEGRAASRILRRLLFDAARSALPSQAIEARVHGCTGP